MSQFEKFKEQFDKDYSDLGDFVEKVIDYNTDDKVPYNGKLEANLDDFNYDSYGYTDAVLKRVYYFKDFDIFVEFSGIQQSYVGTEWKEMKEVKKVIKSIEVYE